MNWKDLEDRSRTPAPSASVAADERPPVTRTACAGVEQVGGYARLEATHNKRVARESTTSPRVRQTPYRFARHALFAAPRSAQGGGGRGGGDNFTGTKDRGQTARHPDLPAVVISHCPPSLPTPADLLHVLSKSPAPAAVAQLLIPASSDECRPNLRFLIGHLISSIGLLDNRQGRRRKRTAGDSGVTRH
ncbi:hypothetical protein ACOMHN_003355 [Nucella lapillus]